MVLPLFHIQTPTVEPLPGHSVVLDGAEGKHAISVRRMRVGEGIQLSDGFGLRVIGQVSAIDGNQLTVTIAEVQREEPANPALTLVQALAKGDRDELSIQAATELGVSNVIPWQAERSISRWDGPKIAKGVERWQSIVAEAAKQALRASTPRVHQPISSKELLGLVRHDSLVLVLDPTAETPLSAVALPEKGEIVFVVGPEGGISSIELGSLEQAGAVRVRLGSEILRTSTAGVAAIAVIQSKLGRW